MDCIFSSFFFFFFFFVVSNPCLTHFSNQFPIDWNRSRGDSRLSPTVTQIKRETQGDTVNSFRRKKNLKKIGKQKKKLIKWNKKKDWEIRAPVTYHISSGINLRIITRFRTFDCEKNENLVNGVHRIYTKAKQKFFFLTLFHSVCLFVCLPANSSCSEWEECQTSRCWIIKRKRNGCFVTMHATPSPPSSTLIITETIILVD